MTDALLVPVILGVVQVVKNVGMSSKYAPLVAIALGIVISGYLNVFDATNIIQGIILGLSASGLWSGAKTLISD